MFGVQCLLVVRGTVLHHYWLTAMRAADRTPPVNGVQESVLVPLPIVVVLGPFLPLRPKDGSNRVFGSAMPLRAIVIPVGPAETGESATAAP